MEARERCGFDIPYFNSDLMFGYLEVYEDSWGNTASWFQIRARRVVSCTIIRPGSFTTPLAYPGSVQLLVGYYVSFSYHYKGTPYTKLY